MTARVRASILGGSGYTGGELLRLLVDHPGIEIAQVTSRGLAGQPVHVVHPNLRGACDHSFIAPESLEPCDVLFSCLPHGELAKQVDVVVRLVNDGGRLIDLSADFRLRDRAEYRRWYGGEHAAPAWLDRFTYGLAEFHRHQLSGARFVSGVGCNATAMNLALYPLAKAGLISRAVCDLKVGSSESGAEPTRGSHHPERSGAVRTFAAAGHRHQAEVEQELMEPFGRFDLHTTVTSVELVRGVLCTAHVFPTRAVDEKECWRLWREAYAGEPCVRIVRDRTGLHRLPDPKRLAGTNWCDVAFEVEAGGGRIVALAAIDNLMKGAAGSAVQCMNIMLGLPERTGLGFPGLNPL